VGLDGVNGYRIIVDKGTNAFELGNGHENKFLCFIGAGFFSVPAKGLVSLPKFPKKE
jgi:hypothetical protein